VSETENRRFSVEEPWEVVAIEGLGKGTFILIFPSGCRLGERPPALQPRIIGLRKIIVTSQIPKSGSYTPPLQTGHEPIDKILVDRFIYVGHI